MNNANLWNAFFEEYYVTFIECFKLSYSELKTELMPVDLQFK